NLDGATNASVMYGLVSAGVFGRVVQVGGTNVAVHAGSNARVVAKNIGELAAKTVLLTAKKTVNVESDGSFVVKAKKRASIESEEKEIALEAKTALTGVA